MEFRVLGPLEVIGPRGPVKIGSGRQRAILALLVIHIGETVSSERLIDEVWGEDLPGHARRAVEVYVSELRRALGAEWIETRPNGYRLRPDGSDIDLATFETRMRDGSTALAAGNPRAAAVAFSAALALWRGPALADLAKESAARSERARLDELHAFALECRMEADLACGRHKEVVPELLRIVAEMPVREAFRTQLMLALYRSGRQAEALAVYHQGREILDRELGVDPGQELERLQQAILAHDPALDLPSGGLSRALVADEKPAEAGPRPKVATSMPVVGLELRVEPSSHEPGSPQRETRRTVTALVGRIDQANGAGGPLDPESRRRPPAHFFEGMGHIVERQGGTVDSITGDALVAIFGVHIAREDDALRAVRAAAEIRESVASLNESVDRDPGASITLRLGLNTGEIVGGERTRASTGDVVSLAARLARCASPGDILLAEGTQSLVRWAVDAEPVAVGDLVDAPGGIGAFRLRAITPGVDGHLKRFDRAMVGRRRELQLLEAAYEQVAADETCHTFTLLGAAGVGKSRLVHEFLRSPRHGQVGRGRCRPYGERAAFWPLAETIKQLAGIDDSDGIGAVRNKIANLLVGHQWASAIADRVAAILGASDALSTPEETLWSVRTLFESVAQARPLVVVWDDVQWAEPAFLDLIEYIGDSSQGASILLLCIARPELLDERPTWAGGKRRSTSTVLEPLDRSEASQMVANLLPGSAALGALETKILEAAEGNPLFVEEYLAMLREDGLIARVGDRWVPSIDTTTIAAPPTIMALLTARLDRLPADEREVLEYAAVVGKAFTRDAIEALAERDVVPDAGRQLRSLARRELIRPDKTGSTHVDAYRFKHILIRDAAYAGLPKERRVVLHEHLAGWLEATSHGELDSADEVIGGHLEQAYRYRIELGAPQDQTEAIGQLAAGRLGRQGRRAHDRGEAGVAEGLLARAAALLPADSRERLALLNDLADSLFDRGAFAAARSANDEVMVRAAAAGFEDLRWRAKLHRIGMDWMTGLGDPVADEVQAARRFFEAASDDQALARVWRLIGNMELLSGRPAESRSARELALGYARRARDIRLEGKSLDDMAWADLMGPTTVPAAIRTADGWLEWARTTGIPSTEAVALASLSRLKAMGGQFDEARRLLDSAITIDRDLGRPFYEASDIASWTGMVEWLAGDLVAAEQALRQGYHETERLGAEGNRVFLAAELARILYLLGRFDEAYEYALVAENLDQASDFRSHLDSLAASVRAMVLARRGQHAAAITLARAAVSIAEGTGLVVYHARALEDLAEVLDLCGSASEARTVRESAIALYEQKGMNVLAARVREREISLRP